MKALKPKLKKTATKTARKKVIKPLINRNLKVSQGQFEEHRLEMNSKLTSVNLEIKSTRTEMNNKFKNINKRFIRLEVRMDKFEQRMDRFEQRMNKLGQRMDKLEQGIDRVENRLEKVEIQLIAINNKIDAKINMIETKIDSKIETVLAAIHQTRMLVEEQNNRNKYVLDGYANLYAIFEQNKQETDQRFTQMEGFIKSLKPVPDASNN